MNIHHFYIYIVHLGYDFQEVVRIRLCGPQLLLVNLGGRKVKVKCKCRYGRASLGHIVQSCPLSHGRRVLRHDQIFSYLDRCRRQRKLNVLREPRLETSSGLRKLDLLVIDEKVVNVIDVQIRADSRVGNMHTFFDAKYTNTPLDKR